MEPQAERRLAAILTGDVVGYSRLMAQDEDDTIRTLRAWREQVAALISEHRGRLVDFTGDNFLAEFRAARDAVECALEIQRVLEARNAALPEARRMRFRIGAHLGDVRGEGDRVYGDGVNIAARLQALAEPGGLCLSAMVVGAVKGLALDLEDIGEQTLKNLPNRVRAYRARPASLPAAPVESPESKSTRRKRTMLGGAIALAALSIAAVVWTRARDASSEANAPLAAEKRAPVTIAVLPFVNLSEDPNQTYFAEGLSEELINALAQNPGLKVVGRTSSFAFKAQNLGIDVIGERLGVANVLEGSVRRDGHVLRITAQLVDARDGFHLWSDTYDRELADVLDIQRDIALAVARVLEVELGLAAEPRQGGTRNAEAHARYLVGKALFWQHTSQSTERAIAELEAALELDPGFALAWIELSYAYGGRSRDPLHRERALASAADAAQRAQELAPDFWRTQAARGWAAMSFHDFIGAERAATRAIELRRAGGDDAADLDLANFLLNMGRPSEQLRELELLRHHDPLVSAAIPLLLLGRKADAVAEYERVRRLGSGIDAPFELALAANETDPKAMQAIAPRFTETPTGRDLLGPREEVLARLRRQLTSPDETSRSLGAIRAIAAEQHGDLDLAIGFLRREYLPPGFGAYYLIWHPGLRETRATAGFKDFVRELGLLAMWRETGKWGDFCRPLGQDDFVCN